MPAFTARAPLRFAVEGMDCAGCARKIETALRRLPEIETAEVNLAAGTVDVFPAADLEPARVAATVAALGYTARTASEVVGAAASRDQDAACQAPAWWRTAKGRLVIVSGTLLIAALVIGLEAPAFAGWAYAAAAVAGLVPVARRAVAALRAGIPFTIEGLMTVATVGAFAIGAHSEAAVVVFLFAVGELLEGFAAQRARHSIKGLADLTPRTARLVENKSLREVPAESLAPGQRVLVRPGDRLPADGRIIAGSSGIDEAPVTGESVPNHKGAGDEVFAGTVNLDGVLTVEVTRAGVDNTIARVVRLVEEAQGAKAPTARFIDRFAQWYMPAMVALAAVVALIPPVALAQPWGVWIYRGLALLLIACPCALVISTPAAIAASLAAGARRGLLVKGGAVLEALAGIEVVALDKTGTLTRGRPIVTDIVAGDAEPAAVLRLAAALEAGSSHPLARAVLARAESDGIAVPAAEDARAEPGRGVTAVVAGRRLFLGSPHAAPAPLLAALAEAVRQLEEEGKTVAALADDSAILGLLAMRDEPREEAADALAALRELGIRPLMLTGDNERTARAVAAGLGIEARAGLLPEDKARIVRELALSAPTAKVGDGINDAPALAAATVGIAIGGGTDIALEAADAALLKDHLGGIAELVRLARRALANIRQNVAIALGLKAVFLVTTVAGLTGLWPAILADTGATVLVTLNALRLLRFDPPETRHQAPGQTQAGRKLAPQS